MKGQTYMSLPNSMIWVSDEDMTGDPQLGVGRKDGHGGMSKPHPCADKSVPSIGSVRTDPRHLAPNVQPLLLYGD